MVNVFSMDSLWLIMVNNGEDHKIAGKWVQKPHIIIYIYGWWYTYRPEKYEFVSWDDEIPNIWKHKKCSKPPTTYGKSMV